MSYLKYIFLLGWLLGAWQVQAQVVPTPAPPQSQALFLTGATVHVGNGDVIQNAAVAFADGKLTYVGPASAAKLDMNTYQTVDISGKHVYPGFILPSTTLGLVEIGAVRASRDFEEQGAVNPEVRGIVAYNTDSHVIPTTRSNGILIAQVTPQGGIVSGRSSIVQLDAWNWEDAAIKMDEGIHMNWPRRMFGPRWWLGETNPRPNPRYAQTVQAIRQTLSDGQTYAKTKVPETTNLKMEAMRGLYDGSVALYLHADRAKDIVLAANLLKEYGVQKIVLVGGAQAYYIKDFLKENNIAVILRNVHSLPSREDEDVDMPYRLPGMLHKAGVKVALGYASHSSARNLGFFAGTAATYGLDKEEALACITLHPAQILGIDDQVGTVESGKNATFFVSEGDALDMRTQSVVHAFIDGREIDLNDKHKMLYERFSKKYEQMKK